MTEGNWPSSLQVLIILHILKQKIVVTILLVVRGTELDQVINILLSFLENLLPLSVTLTLHEQANGLLLYL